MTKELAILLLMTLGLNLLTLTVSYYTLRRYKKIAKLSNLIYDQLTFSRTLSKGLEEDFKQSLHKHLRIEEFEEVATHHVIEDDPLMDLNKADFPLEAKSMDLPLESTNKAITKAESHLVKVLQSKYSIKDSEDPQPAGN